jgi:hypothetical protein
LKFLTGWLNLPSLIATLVLLTVAPIAQIVANVRG